MEKIFAVLVLLFTASFSIMGRVPPRKEHLQGPLEVYKVRYKLWTQLEARFSSPGTAVIVEKVIA
jgi:hypothetical protein